MDDNIIPVVMFIAMAVVFIFFFWFRFRGRAEMQQTIRTALDRGQELTPEIIDRLGQPKAAKHADRRKATIAIALAIALGLFGVILGEEDAVRPLLGVAMFPLTIGIGYLVIAKFSEREPSN